MKIAIKRDPQVEFLGGDYEDVTSRKQPGNVIQVEPPVLPKRRDEYVLAVCDGLIDLASSMYAVSGKELRAPGRNIRSVVRVRQMAMYVAHVVLQLSMSEVGKGFDRDRTTVVHACHLIEDLRDDSDFDAIVSAFETAAARHFIRKCGEW